MSRRKKDPLRELIDPERRELVQLSQSQVAPAVEVIRVKILLAVTDGDGYQDAARSVGRRSGDAVSHLVTRFNAAGVSALTPRHGGGRKPTYGPKRGRGSMPRRHGPQRPRTTAPRRSLSRFCGERSARPPTACLGSRDGKWTWEPRRGNDSRSKTRRARRSHGGKKAGSTDR